MSSSVIVTIAADPPNRLDKALARDAPEAAHLSRSRLARLIDQGAVSRGAEILDSAKMSVSCGDVITIAIPAAAPTDIAPEEIPLDIIYEDADLAVVNKPAGLVVHPAPGTPTGTLVNGLMAHFGATLSGIGGRARPGIVHRIDKDTSGLLVVAKNDAAHHSLAAQFSAHSAGREYVALCYGAPKRSDPRLGGLRGVSFEPGGVVKITTGLARHKTDRQRQAVTFSGGRHAVTRVKLRNEWARAAMIACQLETGRTHQIRVHMAYIGHGLLGDPTYGNSRRIAGSLGLEIKNFGRQALHAASLCIDHPRTGARLCFEAPLPSDMVSLVQSLDNAQAV